ncbi:MAG: HAMP domain-containing sensor histidine kinase [Candidatus Pacebacteria bacterium]|nr:HAMP domain-containing sensor histidine kinase [Candidatus Paceibacterota bacterium]
MSELLVHTIFYSSSIVISLGLGLAVLINNPRKGLNIFYFLTTLCYSIFAVAYTVGVTISDPILSHRVLLFTMVNILTLCFNTAWVFCVVGKLKDYKRQLVLLFGSASALFIFFLTDTSRFNLPSVPKMYFANYYQPGRFYWLFILFFFVVFIYFMSLLFKQYKVSNAVERNRLKYYIGAFFFGYTVGSISFLLEYNIQADPIWSAFLVFYNVPLAYGILKYDLMDIHIVAKNALVFSGLTVLIGVVIVGLNVLSNYLVETFAGFPFWFIPFLSGLIAVAIGHLVWTRIRDVDVLKYEFINNITHKFRTPLTHIRWLSEDLRAADSLAERNNMVDQIQYASMRLFELTNVVIDVARDNNSDYLYRFTKGQLGEIVQEVYQSHQVQIAKKNLRVNVHVDPSLPLIMFDRTRLQFVIQILFENALIYTPANGQIGMSLDRGEGGRTVRFAVKDSGIGISPEQISLLFSKFYRAPNARRADTEGMGIGLYMAKTIVEKHGGKIKAQSEGEGKGSTFSFELPLV